MACQPSDEAGRLGRLRESARQGDWKNTAELTERLLQETLPIRREELGEYLRGLTEALIAAKASRADAAASLARLKAAESFNNTVLDESRTARKLAV